MRHRPTPWLAALLAAPFVLGSAASTQHKHGEGKAGQHHGPRFDDPERWTKAFDDPERASWQKPDEVIKALALKPGAKVADIGAGTGYFAIRLARAVPGGTVYAVDLEPRMVAWLGDRARTLGLANMKAVQGSEGSPNLPEPVDTVLLANVFHHLDNRPAYFRRLAALLRPGARIAVIETRPDAPRGPPQQLRLAVKKIDEEMQLAGYRRVEVVDLLPHQSFTIYGVAPK